MWSQSTSFLTALKVLPAVSSSRPVPHGITTSSTDTYQIAHCDTEEYQGQTATKDLHLQLASVAFAMGWCTTLHHVQYRTDTGLLIHIRSRVDTGAGLNTNSSYFREQDVLQRLRCIQAITCMEVFRQLPLNHNTSPRHDKVTASTSNWYVDRVQRRPSSSRKTIS